MSALAQILPHPDNARRSAILVAEDEVLVRGVVAEHLRDAGFDVIEASNTAEVMDILQSNEPVDLVFTDIAMPGIMNGVMLARWMYLHRPDLRVVLASGSVEPALRLPSERLFLKPYDLDEVEAHIRGLLARGAIRN